MERRQGVLENGALNSRDFIISLGITREGSEEFKLKALYGAVKFCRAAKRSCFLDALKNLRSKNIEITGFRLHEEEEKIFGIKSEEKINSLEEGRQREIFSRVVDFIGMDDDKVRDLRKALYSKYGMDNEGVNIYGGVKRFNLSLLEGRRKRKVWEKLNKANVLEDRKEDRILKQFKRITSVEYIERNVTRKIEKELVARACTGLRQKYETGMDKSDGLDSAFTIIGLRIRLESWAKGPFGRWREDRVRHVIEVAEGWEQNSVK